MNDDYFFGTRSTRLAWIKEHMTGCWYCGYWDEINYKSVIDNMMCSWHFCSAVLMTRQLFCLICYGTLSSRMNRPSFLQQQSIMSIFSIWFAFLSLITDLSLSLLLPVPPVLWCCWLGSKKGIWPVKTEWWGTGVVICLEWFAYGPADATITRHLVSLKSRMVLPFWCALPSFSWRKGC